MTNGPSRTRTASAYPSLDWRAAGCGRLTIDLDALIANYQTYQDIAPEAEIAAVLKCNAYGCGLAPAAQALRLAGCKSFYVANANEGLQLRAFLNSKGGDAAIYVLGGVFEGAERALVESRLIPVLNDETQLDLWRRYAGATGSTLQAVIHIDTGMNRLGLPVEAFESLAKAPERFKGLKIEGLMSHLACAASPDHPMNAQQRERFERCRGLMPDAKCGLSSSAGALLGPEYHFDVVRLGVSLYGVGAFDRPDPRLRTVARLEAPILQVRTAKAGETVGYSATHVFDRDARVATIGAGYGDGFHRATSGKAVAYIDGRPAPMLGRVSMDLIAVDLSEVPETLGKVGDAVELIGEHAKIEDVAMAADTIAYELLTDFGHRYVRRYIYRGEDWETDALLAL